MRVRLTTDKGTQIEYRSGLGFQSPEAIPCLRCGVCCTKWQAPLDSAEAQRIAAALGMNYANFRDDYLQEYPFTDDSYLIRCKDGACIFLRFENALAGCAIHEHKPKACRDWNASLERKECREGLRQKGSATSLIKPSDLLLPCSELSKFYGDLTPGRNRQYATGNRQYATGNRQ